MVSFSRVRPLAAIFFLTSFSTLSSLEQMGQRLSNTPSRLSEETVSMLNARVRAPDSSSSMAMPAAFPQVSP